MCPGRLGSAGDSWPEAGSEVDVSTGGTGGLRSPRTEALRGVVEPAHTGPSLPTRRQVARSGGPRSARPGGRHGVKASGGAQGPGSGGSGHSQEGESPGHAGQGQRRRPSHTSLGQLQGPGQGREPAGSEAPWGPELPPFPTGSQELLPLSPMSLSHGAQCREGGQTENLPGTRVIPAKWDFQEGRQERGQCPVPPQAPDTSDQEGVQCGCPGELSTGAGQGSGWTQVMGRLGGHCIYE